jgi:outer membrane biosynthesis protein TonB
MLPDPPDVAGGPPLEPEAPVVGAPLAPVPDSAQSRDVQHAPPPPAAAQEALKSMPVSTKPQRAAAAVARGVIRSAISELTAPADRRTPGDTLPPRAAAPLPAAAPPLPPTTSALAVAATNSAFPLPVQVMGSGGLVMPGMMPLLPITDEQRMQLMLLGQHAAGPDAGAAGAGALPDQQAGVADAFVLLQQHAAATAALAAVAAAAAAQQQQQQQEQQQQHQQQQQPPQQQHQQQQQQQQQQQPPPQQQQQQHQQQHQQQQRPSSGHNQRKPSRSGSRSGVRKSMATPAPAARLAAATATVATAAAAVAGEGDAAAPANGKGVDVDAGAPDTACVPMVDATSAASRGSIGKRAVLPKSQYKGLAWDKQENSWRVRISLRGRQHHIGRCVGLFGRLHARRGPAVTPHPNSAKHASRLLGLLAPPNQHRLTAGSMMRPRVRAPTTSLRCCCSTTPQRPTLARKRRAAT